jgi:hypothetical protein
MTALTTLSACQTTKIVEVEKPVPIYLTIQPEKPSIDLEAIEWLYLPEQELLAVTPEEFDKNTSNWVKIDLYIKQLQASIIYYEQSTTKPD